MNIKTINLTAESGTRKELCMKKIVHTVEMLQRVDEEKTAIGTTLCGYMECCKDTGYISDDEYKLLKEIDRKSDFAGIHNDSIFCLKVVIYSC